jgi:glutathione S-transferase
MADLTFYTNPQSRGQIIRWMLEEVGAAYDTEYLGYGTSMKAEPYLSINPMGKVPAIRHGDRIVTEVAAICAYLADAFPAAGLAPALDDRADYYRFLFFAAGPLEQAFSLKAVDFNPPAERKAMFGHGCWEDAINGIERMLGGREFITGKFSAADLYVSSQLGFMLMFGMLEPRPVFNDYVARCTDRDAYRRAKQMDEQAVEELKASA